MSKKNGLELLQQEVEIPAVVQRRAQDAFDQIHREAKLADQGIVTMDCEAGRKEQTMKKRGRRTKRALVMAIATAVMVLGTMTVAVATYRKGISGCVNRDPRNGNRNYRSRIHRGTDGHFGDSSGNNNFFDGRDGRWWFCESWLTCRRCSRT